MSVILHVISYFLCYCDQLSVIHNPSLLLLRAYKRRFLIIDSLQTIGMSSSELIRCEECGQEFDTIDSLKEHQKSEREDKELRNTGIDR
jgi:hypothetical protein